MKALDERRILAPADLKFVVSFPRYGHLKLELVLEQISLCRFWALLKGHNYEQIYKGLNSSGGLVGGLPVGGLDGEQNIRLTCSRPASCHRGARVVLNLMSCLQVRILCEIFI